MSPRPHLLVLTFPFHSHITPALRLARLLLAADPDALVTFSTTEAAHRRTMFPADDEHGGRLEFLPFSDGSGDPGAFNAYMASFHAAGARTVAEAMDALAARGRPVTRVVYTLLLPWAADVARQRGIPSALFWIQPASVFAAYFHRFHGLAGVVAEHRHDPSFVVEIPGLAPQTTIRDLPSFLTDAMDPSDVFHSVFNTSRHLMETLDEESPRATVLVNTCQELELAALAAVGPHHVLPVGPVLPSGGGDFNNKQDDDDDAEYMEWLDAKRQDNSVVYVSFGSLAMMAREQLDELLLGLENSGRPYLCVIRKDVKAAIMPPLVQGRLENGMVVEWCDHVRVLSHAAVGSFVTHCGWNSVLESLAAGVPMVCVPGVSDQRINAHLVVRDWRAGVRAQVDDGGVLRAPELSRCIGEVMDDDSEVAAEVRQMAAKWKRVVAEATGKGGSSHRNLMAFMDRHAAMSAV